MAEFSDAETLEVGPNDEVGLLSNLLKSEKPPSDRVVVRKGTVEDVHTTGKTRSHAMFLSLKKQSCAFDTIFWLYNAISVLHVPNSRAKITFSMTLELTVENAYLFQFTNQRKKLLRVRKS